MEENPGFFRHPKWQIFISIVVGLLLYVYLTHRLGGSEKNSAAIMIDTLLFYGSIVFWFFFFAQFVLPVQRTRERLKVFDRLFRYLMGEHGPAVFIQSGEPVEHGSEMKKRGPGIVLIDSASAAMLRTDVRFTRAVGPGVVFTDHNAWSASESEYVARAVDLHPQMVVLGPSGKEDPFDEKQKQDEPYEMLHQRQERRWQTSGLTRNGIEVVPNITVFFKLDSQSGQKITQFVYDERAVRLACSGEGIDPNITPSEGDTDIQMVGWDRLPGMIAADIWRETLARFTLEDLFCIRPSDPKQPGDQFWNNSKGGRMTGFEFIARHMESLMTQEKAPKLDASGRVLTKLQSGYEEKDLVDSEPYRRLHERGVRVEKVIISNLQLRKEINEKIENQWESTWLERAKAERELLEQRLAEIRETSRQHAIRDYARILVKQLKQLPPGISRSETEILKQLVDGTIALIMQEGLLRKRAPNEKNQLIELHEWLQKLV
jgi:hypothetical protein